MAKNFSAGLKQIKYITSPQGTGVEYLFLRPGENFLLNHCGCSNDAASLKAGLDAIFSQADLVLC